jgi:hypothetical protein
MSKRTNDADPLAELLVDSKTVDKTRIATALKGKVAVDAETGRVVLQAGFRSLDLRQKALAFLLGRKVAVLLGTSEVERATSSEVASGTGVPPGSARPTMSSLVQEHRVTRVESSYELSAAQVDYAIDALSSASSAASVDVSKEQPRRRRRVKRSPHADKTKTASPTASSRKRAPIKSKAKKGKRSSSHAGPMPLIEELIAQHFFDTPKTLKEVQQRLKDKRGYDVKVTTLSPTFTRLLRRGALDRERDENGTYEYQTPSA